MNLLLISNGNNRHYCLIKDFNKLLYHLNNTRLACSSVNIVSMVLLAKTFSTPTYRTARNMVPKKSSCPMKNMPPFNLKIIKNILRSILLQKIHLNPPLKNINTINPVASPTWSCVRWSSTARPQSSIAVLMLTNSKRTLSP